MDSTHTHGKYERYRSQFVEFLSETWLGYALVFPAVIAVGGIILYPILQGIWMSFFEKSLLQLNESTWVGFSNYVTIFGDPVFWLSLKNSVFLTSTAVALEFLFGLGLALLLKQKVPGISIFRSISMVTWVLPIVVSVTIFNFLIQPEFGLINVILERLGLPTAYWFGVPSTAMWMIILMHVWRNIPFFAIALYASMNSIPHSYYEAAKLDGAGPLQQFRYITLPQISYTSMIMIIIHVIFTFNNFSFVYLSTGGGPLRETEVLATYIYKQAFESYALGYAASVGTVMMIIMIVFTIVYAKLEVDD